MDRPEKYDPYGGFSIMRIVLSDALSPAAYHPDVLQRMQEGKYGALVPPDKTQKVEEKK